MTTRFCKACFAPLKINSLHAFLYHDLCLCNKCLDALSPNIIDVKVDGVKGIYLYPYQDTIKEKIYTLKGCADIELSEIFLNYYQHEFRHQYRGYVIVPAPSTKQDDKNRGFNHVQEIFKVLKLPILPIIEKVTDFKQSDCKRNERMKIMNKLTIKDIQGIYHKKVLFVDDVSTTQSTLRACLALIKKGQPKKLNFLIVAKVKAKLN